MFGTHIAKLRKEKHLTQTELANSIGISRSALSLYEIEKREPDIDTLNKLAEVLNTSVDYILGNSTRSTTVAANPKEDISVLAHGFQERIVSLLTEKKMTTEDFEKEIYKENGSIYKNEIPSIGILIKIATALDVSTDYLLGLDDSKNKNNTVEFNEKRNERINNMLLAFEQLNIDNQDIIIGETKKMLKQQQSENIPKKKAN